MSRTSEQSRELFQAAKNGPRAELELLLNNGMRADTTDANGLTLLMWASRKGNVDAIETLWKRGASLDWTDKTGRTALHHAALFKRCDAVVPLLTKGANVNAKDMQGWTALDIAKATDKYEIARTLLDAGATGGPPDPGELSTGSIRDLQTPVVMRIVDSVGKRIIKTRRSNPWCERGHLNVTFHQAGAFGGPDFAGLHVGRLSRARKTLSVVVAVSDLSLEESAAIHFVLATLTDACKIAADRFRTAKIEFDSTYVLDLITKCDPGANA
jgi:hypothetical protein